VSSVGLQPERQMQSRPSGLLASSAVRYSCYSVLLILLTVALYYPVRTHPFVNYDDNVYVIDNDHVMRATGTPSPGCRTRWTWNCMTLTRLATT